MDEIKTPTTQNTQASPSGGGGRWLWWLLIILLIILALVLWWVVSNFRSVEPDSTVPTTTEQSTDLDAEERKLLEADLETELDTSEIDDTLE